MHIFSPTKDVESAKWTFIAHFVTEYQNILKEERNISDIFNEMHLIVSEWNG